MKLISDYFIVKSNIKNPDKPIKKSSEPTKQQQDVINADINSNLSIIACAGSGKTTTLIGRICNLLKNGIGGGEIILTTFTRDSARDMRRKLEKKIGRDCGVNVGTMDSLSLHFLRRMGKLEENMYNVGEYALEFLRFLREDDERRVFCGNFRYMFVDEFQDINELQFNIINEFYKNGVHIVGVGDDGQNIYTFRGSNVKYIMDFQKYFGGELYYLTHNFRSTKQIIDVANYTIERAQLIMPKKMIPQVGFEGEKPQVNFFYNQEEQANFIIGQVQKYLRIVKKLEEICILCPMNSMLYKLEEIALLNNIPVNLIDNKEGVGGGIKRGKLTMCTIHKSKGLEWDVVFVVGMNDELFPPEKEYGKIEESRRLFYVATTRARKFLHFVYTPVNGGKHVSRFIGELPMDMINFVGFQKEYLGESGDARIRDKTGVVERIQNLQVEQISYLRRNGILQDIREEDLEVIGVHEELVMPKFVYDNNLQMDFGIFMDVIVCRELARSWGKPIVNRSCVQCMAIVNVDNVTYQIYLRNKKEIDFYFEMGDFSVIEKLDNVLIKLVEKVMKNAKRYGVNPLDIGVHPMNYLPKKWRENLVESYMRYKDKNNSSLDVITDIWMVSLCEQIVRAGRRKMLYISVPMDKVVDLGEKMVSNFGKIVDKLGGDRLRYHKGYGVEGLSGEIDFMVDDGLWEIKMSKERVSLDWVMQLMCYGGMMEDDVGSMWIYNGLIGEVIRLPVIDGEMCKELVEYLRKIN